MLKGFVINLDRHPDRLYQFNQHSDSKYFFRIPAVDKKVIELGNYADFLFNRKALETAIHRQVTLGEIGCTLSHIKTWQAIAEDNDLTDNDFAVVAEDDIQLITHCFDYLNSIVPQLKSFHADIIILHKLGLYTENKPGLFSGKDLTYRIPQNRFMIDNDGSALYLIRKSKAQKLTQYLETHKPYWLADQFSQFCELAKIFILSEMFGYIPENATSDLEQERDLARHQAKNFNY